MKKGGELALSTRAEGGGRVAAFSLGLFGYRRLWVVTGGNELLQVVMSGYGRLRVQSEAIFYKQTDIQPVGIIYRSLSSSSPY